MANETVIKRKSTHFGISIERKRKPFRYKSKTALSIRRKSKIIVFLKEDFITA